jgi:hypothetical protein
MKLVIAHHGVCIYFNKLSLYLNLNYLDLFIHNIFI